MSREVDSREVVAKSICIYCYLLMKHLSSACMLFNVAVSNFCSHIKVPLNNSELTKLGLINWYVNVVVNKKNGVQVIFINIVQSAKYTGIKCI